MINREKVIKGLECCKSMCGGACQKCPYNDECMDVYDSGIAHLTADALELFKDQPTIVHCPDCKHSEYIIGQGYRCEIWEYSFVLNNGFCNYGERKENCNG